jgi:hypothetical protein
MHDPVLIVGAGIVGLTLGQALKKVHPSPKFYTRNVLSAKAHSHTTAQHPLRNLRTRPAPEQPRPRVGDNPTLGATIHPSHPPRENSTANRRCTGRPRGRATRQWEFSLYQPCDGGAEIQDPTFRALARESGEDAQGTSGGY